MWKQVVPVFVVPTILAAYFSWSGIDIEAVEGEYFAELPTLPSNQYLTGAQLLLKGKLLGPESIAFHPTNGLMYTGLMDGRIVAVNVNDEHVSTFATITDDDRCRGTEEIHQFDYDKYPPQLEKVCGRPLGMRFDKQGNLYVADAYFGLFRFSQDGSRELLLSEVDGNPIIFANDLDLDEASNTLFFTQSSDRWGRNMVILDLLSQRPCGKFYSFDLETRQATLIDYNLPMLTNGVTLSHDRESVFVVAGHAIWKCARHAGACKQTLANLPFLPDNIRRHPNKRTYLVGSGAKRSKPFALTNFLAPYPAARNLLARLLPVWAIVKLIPRFGIVAELDLDANAPELFQTWQDPTGRVAWISEAEVHAGYVYMGSWHESHVARIAAKDLPGFG